MKPLVMNHPSRLRSVLLAMTSAMKLKSINRLVTRARAQTRRKDLLT